MPQMTKFFTDSARFIDHNDECRQCGKLLRVKREGWATDRGNFCTIRCAEEHENRHADAGGAGAMTVQQGEGVMNKKDLPMLAGLIAVADDAVYLRLPHGAQRPIDGGCQCDYCKAHPHHTPMWDTLGVPTTGNSRDYVWTLHAPEWSEGQPFRFAPRNKREAS